MELTSRDHIRSLLRSDPRWCVYALGDLTPRMFSKCRWFTPDLTLVLHDYGTSILFAHGSGSIREALHHVTFPVHLQVQQDALDEIKRHAIVTNETHMLRMWYAGGVTTAAASAAAEGSVLARPTHSVPRRLTGADVGALRRLYSDGDAHGESPDFFYDSMVGDGVFFGIEDASGLIAAAGTHLVARDEGAAAIGNVYVRRDRRGHRLSRAVTAAVLEALNGIATIGLNVRADNTAAIRVYQSLGFETHCPFVEAVASARDGR